MGGGGEEGGCVVINIRRYMYVSIHVRDDDNECFIYAFFSQSVYSACKISNHIFLTVSEGTSWLMKC